MILPTMTYPEIANEINKDHKSLLAYAEWIINQNKYRKYALKHPEPVHFKPVFWTSPNKNKYVIIPFSDGKNYMKKYGISFYMFCYYYGCNGLNAVLTNRKGDCIFFRSHLFDRYAERFLNASENKLNLMIEFVKYNPVIATKPFVSATKYKSSIFAKVSDGIILGRWIENYPVFYTFITEEMLKGSEIEYNESIIASLLEKIEQDNEVPIEYLDTFEKMSNYQKCHLPKAG